MNDLAILVFRTEWDGHDLVHEEVWNKVTKVWQPSNEVQRWWVKGETSIDEVSSVQTHVFLSEQGDNINANASKLDSV
jgi:hypothetical protein